MSIIVAGLVVIVAITVFVESRTGSGPQPPRDNSPTLIPTSAPPAAAQGDWRLVWHDDFTSSVVQAAQWNIRNATYLPYENSILTSRPDNVRIVNGTLQIVARREQQTVGSTTRAYTSGYLDTIGKHSWHYGKFEMRARLPTSAGMWPAFWLRADNGLGEIDIMEGIGGMPSFAQQAVLQSTDGDQAKLVNKYVLPSGTIAGWHVYGAVVTPDAISFYVDGRPVYSVTADQAPWLRATFDKPLNIRLNLQVGGTLPNYYRHPLNASTTFPASYVIDWIRVSQHP